MPVNDCCGAIPDVSWMCDIVRNLEVVQLPPILYSMPAYDVDLATCGSGTVRASQAVQPAVDQFGLVPSTVTDASYEVSNGWCTAHGNLTIAAPGSNNHELKVSMTGPFLSVIGGSGAAVGSFTYTDLDVGRYWGVVDIDFLNLHFNVHNSAVGDFLGKTPTFAAAIGDTLSWEIRYRVL